MLNVKERPEKVEKSKLISVYVRRRCKETVNIAINVAKIRGLKWNRFVWF